MSKDLKEEQNNAIDQENSSLQFPINTVMKVLSGTQKMDQECCLLQNKSIKCQEL